MAAMDLQLTFKNTFIEVIEEEPLTSGTARHRSSSVPPCFKQSQDDLFMSGYLGALPGRSQQLKLFARVKTTNPVAAVSKRDLKTANIGDSSSTSTAIEERDLPAWLQSSSVDTESDIDEDETATSSIRLPNDVAPPLPSMSRTSTASSEHEQGPPTCNPGSAGHPEFCRRPCMFAAMGNCDSGASCMFCHMGHKNHNLDKRLREQLRNLGDVERTRMMASVIRERVEEADLSILMAEVLEIFQEWEACLPAFEVANMSRLRKALKRLPLSVIIGHSMGKETESNTYFHARMTDAMNRVSDSLMSK
eukprot:TRINITY_DN8650_c0_g2_i1.p1 TRINITY_DN8650_c0_g2~~TRINITY_DN8650_c0_g2_i1.p1  ORF type:complete len:306 (-),score=74.69 TRINITY_DN8650_c0_g2_i1:206-1123(-)